MSKYFNSPVVGIDISEGFHVVSILSPDGSLYCKTFNIKHNLSGFNFLLDKIQEVEKKFSMKTGIFMESTGIYHISLFHFLKNKKLEAFLINPLITNSSKNKDIRKEKNDKRDSLNIARLGKFQEIKAYDYFEPEIFSLRSLIRDYYKQVDIRSIYKKKLSADIHLVLPGYKKIFNSMTCQTSLEILKKYPSPQALLSADKNEVINILLLHSRKGLVWSNNKYDELIKMAEEAKTIGFVVQGLITRIINNITMIETLNEQIEAILIEIRNTINDKNFPSDLKHNIELIDSIIGIDFISAVALITEIGNHKRFDKPKQLVAYLGVDASVNQSGKFIGTRNKMSKRGSKIARRVLFAAAMASIRSKRNGEPMNKVLKDYYEQNQKNKAKKVALGAVMHKITNYIFAVLRDQKEYIERLPKIHEHMYLFNLEKSA